MRLKYQFLFAVLPLLIAGVGALYVRTSDMAGSLVQARLQLDLVLLLVGALLSALLLWQLWSSANSGRREQQASDNAREQARLEHRRFTERLDHELKNPLTTISANLANLRATETTPDARSSIDGISGQLSRLVRLTDDLRKLAAFESTELAKEQVDVAGLFEDLQILCRAAPVFADRELVLVLPAAPWPVRSILADGDLLQLALYNLLENAAKYSDAGDTIELRAAEDADKVRLTVADTGLGVAKDEQEQMFDELYRGRDVRDRAGSGIGLTLVRRIVEKHGWQLELASEQGRGTQITLIAPIPARS